LRFGPVFIKAAVCIVLLLLSRPLDLFAATNPRGQQSCLVCHKYRFMGRIDQSGRRSNYHVDESMYDRSVHRNVPCRDCHTTITKLPHGPVEEAVNCANQCHIKPPFSQKNFSHQNIIRIYNESVHGIRPDDPADIQKAKPYCKFCHLNPLYTKVDEKRIDFDITLRRCLNCHQQKGVTVAYKHITHRLRKKTSRTPQAIVKLCSKCHRDKALMKMANASKAGLDAVDAYNRSIHGKSIMLGSQQTADCISCHASNALHDIYKKDNSKATINPANLEHTCKQCHAQTNSWFARIAVHPLPQREKNRIIYFAGIFFRLALYGSLFSMVGLLLVETRGRRKEGIRYFFRRGTSWRGITGRRPPQS